jgi:hypothetical protein
MNVYKCWSIHKHFATEQITAVSSFAARQEYARRYNIGSVFDCMARRVDDSPRADYNPVAVNKAIDASNRAGRRIGAAEAKAIHALLKGRH